jgi:hypothetical protein
MQQLIALIIARLNTLKAWLSDDVHCLALITLSGLFLYWW